MIVSFSGNDGSGKSTLAREVEKTLKQAGFSVVYREEFNYFLLKYVLKLLPRKTVAHQTNSFMELKDKQKAPSLLHRMWPYAIFCDLLCEYIFLRMRYRNSIVIMDRYKHDFLMSFEYLHVSSPTITWLFSRLPQADVTCICFVDPEIAYNRKKHDHSQDISFFKTQTARYTKYAEKNNLKTLHSDGTLEETINNFWTQWREQLMPVRDMKEPKQMCVQGAIEDTTIQSNELKQSLKLQSRKVANTLRGWMHLVTKYKLDYALIKTVTPYESYPTDIDIIIHEKDHVKVHELLRNDHFSFHGGFAHKALTFTKKDTVPIDLHTEISWHKLTFLTDVDVLKNTRQDSFYNYSVSVPMPELDLAILMAHSLYQHHYTTWGESKIMSTLMLQVESLSCHLYKRSEFKWMYRKVTGIHNLLHPNNPIVLPHEYAVSHLKPNYNGKLIFWHPPYITRIYNGWQAFDALLYIYRSLRYHLTGRLPFNENWLHEN